MIYVIGGNDGKVLSSVDALNLKTLTWHKMASMSINRDELAVSIGPDNKIYAVGGYGGNDK
jgi:hypothetical protein